MSWPGKCVVRDTKGGGGGGRGSGTGGRESWRGREREMERERGMQTSGPQLAHAISSRLIPRLIASRGWSDGHEPRCSFR